MRWIKFEKGDTRYVYKFLIRPRTKMWNNRKETRWFMYCCFFEEYNGKRWVDKNPEKWISDDINESIPSPY